MTEDEATGSGPADGESRAERHAHLVAWATMLGVGLAAVGLVDGLVMALDRKVADCPDETYFPEGTTDFTCYVHPQGGIGIAVAVLSVVLGILVVFGSIAATSALVGRPGRR